MVDLGISFQSLRSIISSFRNLCSKHLLSGLCFEGNVAEKQILPEQRKEKTGPDSGPPSCPPPTQCLLWWAVGPLTRLLPCESLSEDSKRKGHRKCESEETAEWRRNSYHRKEHAAPFPRLQGCPETLAHHREFRCVLVCCSLSIYSHLCVGAFLFCCSLLVCFACRLVRPTAITLLALYCRGLTQEPFLFTFCSESN